MKCSIFGTNIRVFGKSVHSLAKMGDELYIECDAKTGMTLSVVNSSRSAYMSFAFDVAFFSTFDFQINSIDDEDEEVSKIKCKIDIQPCVSIFKSLPNIDKLVDKCSVQIDDTNPRVVFKLDCRHGVLKTFTIPFLESESLQAAYRPENCQNNLIANTKLLADAFSNFHSTQEEITMVVNKKQVELKSYTDGPTGDHPIAATRIIQYTNAEIYSHYPLQAEEFDEYTVTNDTGITFCLKEIKALLTFTEMLQQSVAISFDHGGKPIIFTIHSPSMFKVTFVLATIGDVNNVEPEAVPANTRNTGAVRTGTSKQKQPLTRTFDTSKNGSFQQSVNAEIEPQAQCSGWKGNNPVGTATPRTSRDDANNATESEPPTVKRFKSLFLGNQNPAFGMEARKILVYDTDEDPEDE